MLKINWDDVVNVWNLCVPYLIPFAIFTALLVVVNIVVSKKWNSKKKIVRKESAIAFAIALALVVNMLSFGPMSTLITLATGKGVVAEETIKEAQELAEKISEEGIVLLKNEGLLPLNENVDKVNIFGWAATNTIVGGSGSGSLSDHFDTVGILEAFENAGVETNKELIDFYKEYRKDRPAVELFSQDWTLPEPPARMYSESLIENSKDFSNVAFVVISRTGAEGADLPQNFEGLEYNNNSDEYEDFSEGDHYLSLSRSERDLVELVTSNFDDVIVIYNGAGAFEMGFVEEYPQIKGALWVTGTGHNGMNSLPKVVYGEVSPSGKTSNTFAYDLRSNPNYYNFGDFEYENMDEFVKESQFTDGKPTFVNYVENIYVGYKYYETAAKEGLFNYEEVVQYPFGYGLSYTSFDQAIESFNVDKGKVSVKVKVTNTGKTAGKDVVQLYYTPPYYNSSIEKSDVNLLDIAKTELLEPGASQTFDFEFDVEKLASFDTYVNEAWVLERGNYEVSLRTDSHTIVDTKSISIKEDIVYDENNKRSTDDVAATTRFGFVEGDLKYLSRKDGFKNHNEVTKAPVDFNMSEESKAGFYNDINYDPKDFSDPNDIAPIIGKNNGLKLVDYRGVDFDDPSWEALLDQVTVDEMINLIALGGYQTAEIPSIEKIPTRDLDGPAAINNNFTGVGSVGMPTAIMIANTFSGDIAYEFGTIMGKMASDMGVTGWYAPGMNLHRSPFGGRNFEYYSEDGMLSGIMASNVVGAAMEEGVYSYIKHFALNDQEVNRWRMLATWSSEQALRENYLLPFEMSVKDGKTTAVMSAYNYIGNEWAGSSDALLNKVLRDEWGFRGMVLTDYFAGFNFMDADRAIRGGGDFSLIPYDNNGNFLDDTTSSTALVKMRAATKNILYAAVNSRAYETENYKSEIGMKPWQKAYIGVDIALGALLVAYQYKVYKEYRKETEE